MNNQPTKPLLLGLSGKRGSGKGSVCDILQYKCGFHHPDVHIFNFADALKNVCAAIETPDCPEEIVNQYYSQTGKAESCGLFGLTRGELLQQVGDTLRQWQPTLWVETTMKMVNATLHAVDTTHLLVVADIRYPNEAEAVKALGGIIIRIEGDPLNQRGDGTRNDAHLSETALDNYEDFDYILLNNGTRERLAEAVQTSLRYEMIKRDMGVTTGFRLQDADLGCSVSGPNTSLFNILTNYRTQQAIRATRYQ